MISRRYSLHSLSQPLIQVYTCLLMALKFIQSYAHIGSGKFSVVTFDAMMYVVERLMETGCPIILEGNFAPSGMKKIDEAGEIKRLIETYAYRPLTYKFKGDTNVLHKRFAERLLK